MKLKMNSDKLFIKFMGLFGVKEFDEQDAYKYMMRILTCDNEWHNEAVHAAWEYSDTMGCPLTEFQRKQDELCQITGKTYFDGMKLKKGPYSNVELVLLYYLVEGENFTGVEIDYDMGTYKYLPYEK